MSRSPANIIENLPNPKVGGDSNILVIKNRGDFFQKNQNILQSLAFMQTFDEISQWVAINSNGLKFIANPTNASDTDRDNCLTAVQLPVVLALKKLAKRRKNGRDKHLLEAVEVGDFMMIANILVSAAWTYWQNHGFATECTKAQIRMALSSQLRNNEKNQQKKDFQRAQINHIGAAVDFQKAQKKGAYQEYLDFLETEEILRNIDFEDEL